MLDAIEMLKESNEFSKEEFCQMWTAKHLFPIQSWIHLIMLLLFLQLINYPGFDLFKEP